MIKKIIIIIILTILVSSLPLAANFGKTGKSTSVLGRDYSLLTKSQIISKLTVDFPVPESIALTQDNRQFSFKLSSISASINHNRVASNLLFRRLNQGVKKYFTAFFEPKDFSLEIIYDDARLTSELQNLSQDIDRPFVPTELALDKGKINVITGQIGQKTDIASLKETIISAISQYQLDQSIPVPVKPVGDLPSDNVIAATVEKAQKIIGKSLKLNLPDQSLVLNDQVLIGWVGFDNGCSSGRISEYTDNLRNTVKKDPVDAVFKFENGKVIDFQAAQDGYTLDSAALSAQICPKINELLTTDAKSLDLTMPLAFTAPKVKNSDVNDMGIKELLGRGKSTFKHSNETRNFNVSKGASIVNRILVAPGETFSFLKHLGDVSLDNGFKKAYVIRAGKTELDVGGGICQVSTTLFRAMLNSGLDITQRQHHAYRVGYYEEDSPPGYDATVFIPNPDLKFVNDTGHYLLIQNTYDGKNKTLVYEIYGTSDGRKTEITNYRQWGYAPPPPDVYVDDPTLPPGKVIQDEQRISGLKTSFDWKVTRNGEVVHQKTFVSNYVPWAAVFRRGPQTN